MNRVVSFLAVFGLFWGHFSAFSQEFDLILQNGRVMDPETGMDSIRNVGIRDGKIASISKSELTGAQSIDASGLVVAPGFIDLHQHAWDADSIGFKIRDGVTTLLELEVGTDNVAKWYADRKAENLPLNHGVAIGHIKCRMRVLGDFPSFLPKSDSKAATVKATGEQIARIRAQIARGLDEGAVAVGFGLSYTPAASHDEVRELFRVAAEYDATCHVHIRDRRQNSPGATREVIEYSAETGAPLVIVHLQASGASKTEEILNMLVAARQNGTDVSAEVYPWTAGMTDIKSAIFADGWQKSFGLSYNDLQWGETGERLTEETFRKYRETGGLVIVHSNPESTVTYALKHPETMIASDGLKGHPRNAGTFGRVLGFYVREKGEIDLMTALAKISYRPAKRLEARVPAMKKKGRVQVGADADLTLFDPKTVREKATFTDAELLTIGIPHVLVAGQFVVRDGKIAEQDRSPGRAIRAPVK
ncbi:MAG: amidohydrolase family protein [Verrucomicrobiales bacterium]|nr:amidohydrolase family protein [Verrucomicrobiales bacterium]